MIDLIEKKLSGFRGFFTGNFRSLAKRFFFRFFPQIWGQATDKVKKNYSRNGKKFSNQDRYLCLKKGCELMLRTNTPLQSHAGPGGLLRRVGTIWLKDWRISAYSLLLVSIFLIIVSNLVHGDDLTGQAVDDPKDLMPAPSRASAPPCSSTDGQFASMPGWARGNVLPPLPAELRPMGGKTPVAKPPPPPQPLAPPKDTATVVTTTAGSSPTPASTEKTSADNNPALIAVSPFLQWIKNNPQAAAAQARQQAGSYQGGSSPDAGTVNGINNVGHSVIVAPGGSGDPYWLPPLIDSADFGTAPVGGSAAIYSTPQR